MATPHDMAFLRLAVAHAVADRPSAERCLALLEESLARGQARTAPEVAFELGLVTREAARKLSDLARAALEKTPELASPTRRFSSVEVAKEKASPTPSGARAAAVSEKGEPRKTTQRLSAASAAPTTPARASDVSEREGESELVVLEDFEVEGKLGRGCAGASYAARRNFEPVVVKVLSRRFEKHGEILERILDEARRAKGFSHENVVSLKDVVRSGGRDALVFERARGRTLAQALEEGPLPSLRATEIVLDLARGLHAAHERGIFHGDVRPEKVFLEGNARLSDFGLSQASCLGAGFGQLGLSFGHPDYLAPEVLQEGQRKPGALSDVYALGILLYELVCGHAPFGGPSFKTTLLDHLEKALPPPPEDVSLSSAAAALILRMTAKDPRRRLPDMAAVIAAIDDYRKAREAGLTSDAKPLADAPLVVDREVTGEAWGRESGDAASRSDEWAALRIERPERVGPEEWVPDERPAARARAPGKVEPSRSRGGTETPVKAHAGYAQALQEAALATARATAPGATSRETKAGARLDLRGSAFERAHGRRTAATLVAASLLLASLFGVAYGYGRWKKSQRPAPYYAPGVDPDERPAPPPEDPAIAKLQHDRKLQALAEQVSAEVMRLAKTGDYKRALELARLARLEGQGQDELRSRLVSEPAFLELRSKLVSDTMALARAQFARESKAIEEQLAAREIERASALARNIRSWAVLDLVPLAAKLQESVESARDAASHPFGAPKDGSPDRSEVESRVREVFSRGSAVFYDGGGVELEYRGAEDGFDQDSTVLLGKPPRAEGKGKASSLRLEGSSGPVLLVHRLPFVRPVSARVELTVPAKRAPGAVLAILAGAERERASGTGVTWTLAPSRLDARGLAPLPGGVGRLVPFEPGSAHALSLELGAPSEDGTVVLQGALDREPPGERASTDEGRLHGSFAIYVKDADVSLTLVRLSGVVDLPALARMKNDRKK